MKNRPQTVRAKKARRPDSRPSQRGRTGRRAAAAAPAGGPALTLPAECTLADAETLKLRLTALVKSVKPVTVDVRSVRRIDTASMQLLAAFARDRRAGDLAMKLSDESPVFDEAARLLGLRELFGLSGTPGTDS